MQVYEHKVKHLEYEHRGDMRRTEGEGSGALTEAQQQHGRCVVLEQMLCWDDFNISRSVSRGEYPFGSHSTQARGRSPSHQGASPEQNTGAGIAASP